MARKAMILKQKEEPKFSTRYYNRCKICGRPHAYLRDYGICRICFRELAYKGQIPGVKKGILVNLFPSCCVFCGSAYTMYAFPAKPCLTKKSSPICPQMTGGSDGVRKNLH